MDFGNIRDKGGDRLLVQKQSTEKAIGADLGRCATSSRVQHGLARNNRSASLGSQKNLALDAKESTQSGERSALAKIAGGQRHLWSLGDGS